MFRAVSLPIIRSFALYVRYWHMLYRFDDSLRAGSGWNCSSKLILHASCRQTCITCANAECTVQNPWWWAETLPETCRVSYRNKFGNYCVWWFYCKEIWCDPESYERKIEVKNLGKSYLRKLRFPYGWEIVSESFSIEPQPEKCFICSYVTGWGLWHNLHTISVTSMT